MARGVHFQLDAILDLIPNHTRIRVIQKRGFNNNKTLYEGYRKGIHKYFEGQLFKYDVDCIYLASLGVYPTLNITVVENIKDEKG